MGTSQFHANGYVIFIVMLLNLSGRSTLWHRQKTSSCPWTKRHHRVFDTMLSCIRSRDDNLGIFLLQQRGTKDQPVNGEHACPQKKYTRWCGSIMGKCLYSLISHVVTGRTLGCHGESCWNQAIINSHRTWFNDSLHLVKLMRKSHSSSKANDSVCA